MRMLQHDTSVKRASMAGLLAVILASAVEIFPGSAAAAATNYAYCAVSRGVEMVYEDCSFNTLAECREELKGLGGFCQPNPRYVRPQPRGGAPAQAPDSRRR